MRAFGASQTDIDTFLEQERGDDVFELDKENGDAFALFCACQTQWRQSALATLEQAELIRTGLDYPAVEVAARALDLDWTGELLAQIQALEAAAMLAWAGVRRARPRPQRKGRS